MKSMLVALIYVSSDHYTYEENRDASMIPITEWDEITQEEYNILSLNLHRIKNNYGQPVLIVQENNINQTLSNVMKQVEKELFDEKLAAERKAAKKVKQREEQLARSEAEKQYAKDQRAKLYEQLRQEFN